MQHLGKIKNNDYAETMPEHKDAMGEEKEEYPCGLCLNLDSDTLAKLGFTGDLPEVGTVISFKAKSKVCMTNEMELENGEVKSMTLQITDMEIDKPKKSTASVLYDKKDE